jgi:hypothetical protein
MTQMKFPLQNILNRSALRQKMAPDLSPSTDLYHVHVQRRRNGRAYALRTAPIVGIVSQVVSVFAICVINRRDEIADNVHQGSNSLNSFGICFGICSGILQWYVLQKPRIFER